MLNIMREGEQKIVSQPRAKALNPKEFPQEPGVYAIDFEEEGIKMVKIGFGAFGANERFQAATQRGINHKLTRWVPYPHPRSLETNIQRYLNKFLVSCLPVIGPDGKLGRPLPCSHEIFYLRPGCNYHQAFDIALETLAGGDEKWAKISGTPDFAENLFHR
jgi:hypothetical protein